MELEDFIFNRNWKIRSIDQKENSEYFFPEFIPCEISSDKTGMFLKTDTKYGLKEIFLNFFGLSGNCKSQFIEGMSNDKVGFYIRKNDGIKEMRIYKKDLGKFLIEESIE